MFTYGQQGKASYQLISLAHNSRQATQTVQYDCNQGQSSVVGWNGVNIPVSEKTVSLMQRVEVDNCKVTIYIYTHTLLDITSSLLAFSKSLILHDCIVHM